MKFFIFFTILITISKAISDSLLTGTYDPNSTVLINERRDIKEIDVLRQIINQETLIRLGVVKDVKSLMEDVKRRMESIETMVSSLEQTVETLKYQVNTITQENNRNAFIPQGRLQEWDQMIKTMNENITDIYEYLTTGKGLKLHRDCRHLFLRGYIQSGVYRINPFENESHLSLTNVYCDMVTEGGGWTAIQKRRSGVVDFNKTWVEYKTGFGNVEDSYWIGNDLIHQLTKGRNSSLYVSIKLRNGADLYEIYDQFSISDEADNYKLFLGGPAKGALGDSMLHTSSSYRNLSGMSFTTPDRDNDRSGYNCANYAGGGGWWFNDCNYAFLNGPWSLSVWYRPWYPLLTNGRDITETLMMIKPH